jgi:hypothetical protein
MAKPPKTASDIVTTPTTNMLLRFIVGFSFIKFSVFHCYLSWLTAWLPVQSLTQRYIHLGTMRRLHKSVMRRWSMKARGTTKVTRQRGPFPSRARWSKIEI